MSEGKIHSQHEVIAVYGIAFSGNNTRALQQPRMADRTLFTSAHVEYLAAVIFYLLA